MSEVTTDLAEKLNLDMPRGALVKAVGEKSPAQKAGIQRGDVVISFAGQEISDLYDLLHIVAATEIGKSVEVVVLRKGGEEKTLNC